MGAYFGLSPIVAISGVSCPIITLNSLQTQVICVVPPGQGQSRFVQVQVSSQLSNTLTTFSYNGPTLTSIIPSSGPTLGGSILTIFGVSLGTSGTVQIGGASCPVLTENHTMITCTIPPGQGINLNVVVIVSSLSSASGYIPTYSYNPPTILSVSPLTGPTSGGITLTVNGTNFGISGYVVVGSSTCVSSGGVVAHSLILCTLPAGSGAQSLFVQVGSLSSAPVTFTYDPPIISNIFPTSGPTSGGTTLTIFGQSFGTSGIITIGGVVCPILPSTYTQASIQCQLPVGQGANLPVVLSSGSLNSPPYFFSYAAPVISSLSPNTGPTSGNIPITITGNSFGSIGSVTIGGNVCILTGAGYTQTSIQCILPQGTGLNQAVLVNCSDQINAPVSFNYNAPTLVSVSPVTVPTVGGSNITISGSNFGGAFGNAQVTLGGRPCIIASITHFQLVCTAPSGSLMAPKIVLTVSGQSSNSLSIGFIQPSIVQVSGCPSTPSSNALATSDCSIIGASVISISGSNFGSNLTSGFPVVSVAAANCPVISFNDTLITCQLPARPIGGFFLTVVVTVVTQSGSANLVSYQGPEIFPLTISINGGATSSAISAVSTSDTSLVSFQGKNFGSSPLIYYGPSGSSNLTSYFSCTFVSISGGSSQTVTCRLNGGIGSGLVFQVYFVCVLFFYIFLFYYYYYYYFYDYYLVLFFCHLF